LNSHWFFTCPPRDLAAFRTRLASVPGARAIDGFAPPENILFLANKVRSGCTHNQRATPRLLFGTSVWYRTAGGSEDDVGFTYNLSEGGLYVRTLAPVEGKTVWLELQPPRSNRRVRLVGEVVWQRPLRLDQHATTPPGFAIKLTDGAQSDMDAWREGYEAFRADMGL
jgi:Tfp pilus assembly protein PilZ